MLTTFRRGNPRSLNFTHELPSSSAFSLSTFHIHRHKHHLENRKGSLQRPTSQKLTVHLSSAMSKIPLHYWCCHPNSLSGKQTRIPSGRYKATFPPSTKQISYSRPLSTSFRHLRHTRNSPRQDSRKTVLPPGFQPKN